MNSGNIVTLGVQIPYPPPILSIYRLGPKNGDAVLDGFLPVTRSGARHARFRHKCAWSWNKVCTSFWTEQRYLRGFCFCLLTSAGEKKTGKRGPAPSIRPAALFFIPGLLLLLLVVVVVLLSFVVVVVVVVLSLVRCRPAEGDRRGRRGHLGTRPRRNARELPHHGRVRLLLLIVVLL